MFLPYSNMEIYPKNPSAAPFNILLSKLYKTLNVLLQSKFFFLMMILPNQVYAQAGALSTTKMGFTELYGVGSMFDSLFLQLIFYQEVNSSVTRVG